MGRKVLLALMMLALPGAGMAADVGGASPNVLISDGASNQISLDAFRGKVIYLDFWASWCTSCSRSLPWMNSLQRKFGEHGLIIVAVNLDTEREQAERILQRVHPEFFVGFDPEGRSPALYGIRAMPSSFLIDQAGMIVSVFSGFDESETQRIERDIASLLE